MFHFRLEPLVKIRDNILKERQAELAKAYDARHILQEHQQSAELQIEQNIESARQMILPGNKTDIQFLLGLRRQEDFLRAEIADIQQKIVVIDKEIEVRRLAVVEANKDWKMLEKLKEKQLERYNAEEDRKETEMLDEAAQSSRNPPHLVSNRN